MVLKLSLTTEFIHSAITNGVIMRRDSFGLSSQRKLAS